MGDREPRRIRRGPGVPKSQLLALTVLADGRARRSTETVVEVTYHRGEVVSVHRRLSWQAADALVRLGLAADDHTGGDLAVSITAAGTEALAVAVRLDPLLTPVRMRHLSEGSQEPEAS